jgi:hypothetical protein
MTPTTRTGSDWIRVLDGLAILIDRRATEGG